MPQYLFPPLELADENGLLAVGGDLSPENLLTAYKQGIFVWPIDETHLTWFSPPKRAILFFDKFHVNKSLKRVINKNKFKIKKNTDFKSVITACAKTPRPTQDGTWITQELILGYTNFHEKGFCDSIEVYLDNKLVGGIYGVRINNSFSAESMFYTEPNASKVALYHLVEDLKKFGITWLDCQVQNPFLESLGVIEVTRDEYTTMLNEALS